MTKENVYINTATQVCQCGTTHDAFTAALRLARANVKLDEFGEVCPQWFMAVGLAFHNIASLFADAKAQHKLSNSDMTVTVEHRTQMQEVVKDDERRLAIMISAAGFQNPDLTKDIAKYICEEIKAGDTCYEEIAAGPSLRQLQQWGFAAIPIDGPIDEAIAKIAELLGINPSAIQKTH